MHQFKGLFSLPASLLLCLPFLHKAVLASPSIDVGLEASFPAPPFLVELLETAALENRSCYLPLLDTIASGRLSSARTDEDLYTQFLDVLRNDGHLVDPAAISSFKLALSVHEAAPKIEAYYQFWRTTGERDRLGEGAELLSGVEIWREDGTLCKDALCNEKRTFATAFGNIAGRELHTKRVLQFDRLFGDAGTQKTWTLYIDPTSPDFSRIFPEWRKIYSPFNAPFRVRYKPSAAPTDKKLAVSGYGIELALKRTDYIVIDDRQAEDLGKNEQSDSQEVDLEAEPAADLQPLSVSELSELGVRAASFIMASEDPFDTLMKVSQDFPKHASALSAYETSAEFLEEHTRNRDVLPPGYNIFWINGVQIDARNADAFSLLEHLRSERKLVIGFQDLGFTAPEAVSVLSHPEVTQAQASGEPQRYDWRDATEGGKVLLWLNNIEKDKRYKSWPDTVTSVLQRTFPGQLPTVRKDIQNIVFPINFSDRKDIVTVVDTLQNLVRRMIAARFAIVPSVLSQNSIDQAKVLYYLNNAYGLAAVMKYFETALEERRYALPSKTIFETVVSASNLRANGEQLSLSEVLQSDKYNVYVENAQKYLRRLGAAGANPSLFVNGVPLPNGEDFLQIMSQRVSSDLRIIQQGVYEKRYTQDMWLPSIFLESASHKRNPLIEPEDETDIQLFDIGKLSLDHNQEMEALLPSQNDLSSKVKASVVAIMDMNTKEGAELLLDAIEFALGREDVDLALKHHCSSANEPGLSSEGLYTINSILKDQRPNIPHALKVQMQTISKNLWLNHMSLTWPGRGKASPLTAALGLSRGQSGVLLNGRLITLSPSINFTTEDFETFLLYEQKKRIKPVTSAIEALGLVEKVNSPHALARLTSLVALSTMSDVPEGIYDSTPSARVSLFEKWDDSYTCIKSGELSSSVMQIVASIDPVSEIAQSWIPILRVLSQLDGVYTRVFLNPKVQLQELPIKRFYRQVVSSQPEFSANGSLQGAAAHFTGIPTETLLTMNMDTPPSWLVAPKESVYDLDNIKLSSVKLLANVEATYELEHILIEGHSKDVTLGQAPRGAQLSLGTESDPNFAGTIIMANLGYFQFKANPGVYNLALQSGRSQEIFHIDSAGTNGNKVQSGDETTEISLISFQGATVFPRLSRRTGKDTEDVLETSQLSAGAIVSKGAELADNVLAKAGVSKGKAGSYLAKGLQFGQNILSKAGIKSGSLPKKHADINIFSVASGHLYERMLNIMMVSVMRHTKHTVKFWFIEQFLSPSFKSFLPTIAAEYGFEYEMVTYKWPHWLRAQKEKQRVIWGYKILFLDVLFPLDLDKVIFVDADQIVRTDMYELVTHDLEGAPYGFTPMCDSRTEMEGFRFWKQGYWKTFLRGLPYHISALYVVDLKRFRQIAAGDRLRGQYHQLSADPNSLSNLDQDLPNHMQMQLPIHSLPQEWLWCETWCSDESLKQARTIDLCNNPQTKEPKLDRARRQVPEWTVYDDEIADLAKRKSAEGNHAGIRVEAAEEIGVGTEKDAEKTRDEL